MTTPNDTTTPTIITSRTEARANGLKRYFTGKPCKRGHTAERHTGNGTCVECARLGYASWNVANREKELERKRRWRAANLDTSSARRCYAKALQRGAPAISPEEFNTTVPVYAERNRLTEETGVAHDVDHILPIKHGGTHTVANLQVATRKFNADKRSYHSALVFEEIVYGSWKGPLGRDASRLLYQWLIEVCLRLDRQGPAFALARTFFSDAAVDENLAPDMGRWLAMQEAVANEVRLTSLLA